MKRISTPDFLIHKHSGSRKERHPKRVLSPRKETIDFLVQFSRSYHVETSLPKELSGMVLS